MFDYFGKSFGRSISKWESSYFGGYERVLREHPLIDVPRNIVTILPEKCDTYIPYNLREKLVELFLYKLNNSHLSATFIQPIAVASFHVINPKTGMPVEFLKVKKNVVISVINSLIEQESELGSMFEYYRQFLIDTEYCFVKPKPKKKGDGKDKAEGEKGESEKGDKSPDDEFSDDDGNGDDGEIKGTDLWAIQDEKHQLTPRSVTAQESQKALEMLAGIKEYKPFSFIDEKPVTNKKLKESTTFKKMKMYNQPTEYSDSEVKLSNRLVNMLDISFEPKSDKVPNLKMGKLDAVKIAEIPSGNTHVYYSIEENQSTKPFRVCILADESGSMTCEGRRDKQRSLMKVLFRTFKQIMPSERIFVYGHSGDAESHKNPEVRIYNDECFDGFEKSIDKQFRNSWNENYDGPVIECIYERIRKHTSDNILFISISDGQPAGDGYGGSKAVAELKMIIEKCKRDGFVTIGIGIEHEDVRKIYNNHLIVSDEQNANTMIGAISSIVNRVVKSEFQND